MNRELNRSVECRWMTAACRWLMSLMVLCLFGCHSDDESEPVETVKTVSYKVAVIMENEDFYRWQQTAVWALENLDKAQQGMKTKVKLELEYKDQSAKDIDDYIYKVANDTTYKAVIGPCVSRCAEKMASAIGEAVERHVGTAPYRKPMISPSATDVEYQRKFSGKDYVWNLAESDLSQIEKVISSIADQYYGMFTEVMLLTPDDGDNPEGNSYRDWFGFVAEEYGVHVKGIQVYHDTWELKSIARTLPGLAKVPQFYKVVFVPRFIEDIIALDNELNLTTKQKEYEKYHYPLIICTDMFLTPSVSQSLSGNPRLSYEGIDLCAMPESGFTQAYFQHFGSEMINGESNFYDAVCLLTFAAALQQHTGHTLNESVREIVDGDEGVSPWACYVDGMRMIFEQLSEGICPTILGCTGTWEFDAKYHTNRLNSIYRHWRFYHGEFVTVNYISSEGTSHSTSSRDVWDWQAKRMQVFENDTTIDYRKLDKRWALLVAGSKGWGNYRFQADVLAMYNILLNHGYDQDHIVVVAEDDLAFNKENKNDMGAVRVLESGDNLYDPYAIDYKLSDLTPDDIGDILHGKKSQKLPKVINATEDDNIFILWSGHGMPRQLDFGGNRTMTYTKMRDILSTTPHRRMMVTVESCYGGGLGQYCEGIDGALFLTAASPYEECHAARWSKTIGVYLTNGFSEGFQEIILEKPHVSLQELYYSLARTVSGSHVKLYNLKNYGSIYSDTMEDYLE